MKSINPNFADFAINSDVYFATQKNIFCSLKQNMTEIAIPKLFVSYSQTTPEYEDWVLNLATELRESGVNVILDKWDLKEEDDANAFMERMVANNSVNKILIVCDRKYAEKANNRSGGVGTETQIISAKVCDSVKQSKFVLVVA